MLWLLDNDRVAMHPHCCHGNSHSISSMQYSVSEEQWYRCSSEAEYTNTIFTEAITCLFEVYRMNSPMSQCSTASVSQNHHNDSLFSRRKSQLYLSDCRYWGRRSPRANVVIEKFFLT